MTSPTDVVSVPERGEVVIGASLWKQLAGDPSFQGLLDGEILRVSRGAGNHWRLHGSCYVGRALCGDVLVEVSEKTPGAVAALLRHASRGTFRVDPIQAPGGDLTDLMALLVHEFLGAVRHYASRGRAFSYISEAREGPLAGGKINIPRTLQLRARGLGHLLAFQKNTTTHNTGLNRLVLAALREVDGLATITRLDDGDLADARGLALLFSDCLGTDVLTTSRDILTERAWHASSDSALSDEMRELAQLAAIVLSHESFGHATSDAPSVPRAWFINLETLFQTAVAKTMSTEVEPPTTVISLPSPAPFLFSGGEDARTLHPDLVVRRPAYCAVGDVKYKVWKRQAAASDLYQLLVHAAGFGAQDSFLVYPGSAYDCVHLGRAVTGSNVFMFCVDITDLESGVGKVCQSLQLRGTTMPRAEQPEESVVLN